MSFFLATVPEGTQLYHGTWDPNFIKGMQWLAFEPEHALIFAGPRRGPPPGEDKIPPHSEIDGSDGHDLPHDVSGWKHHDPIQEFEQDGGLPSRHREHNDVPPTDGQGPRKHSGHGPPPLPPGHIYKPYPPPPRKGGSDRGSKRPWNPPHRRPPPPDLPGDSFELRSPSSRSHKPESQQPLHDVPPSFSSPPPSNLPAPEQYGYLHTYSTRHALNLLYIDGLSAGKTSNGTLDSQDQLLLNLTGEQPGGGMGNEMQRARGLCELAAGLWEGRADGVIRMEGGFEVILCEFEKHLERVDVVRVDRDGWGDGKKRRGVMGGWQYIKAVTSRYNGVGGDRVKLNYDHFVSVFAHNIPGLWDNDVQSDTRMPRLTNVAPSTLHTLRDEVTSLVLSTNWAFPPSKNWQATADTIVARYSAPLHHITSSAKLRSDPAALGAYIHSLLRPFVDAGARNASLETARCTAQLVAPLTPRTISEPLLAHRALHAVTTRICDTLLTALSISTAPAPHVSYMSVYAARAVDEVKDLVDWLGWTSWKECGTCGDEEVCFVPIWPMGAREDHARPRCRGEEGVAGQAGYWGRQGPPPRKGSGPGGDER
ncbi:hypothetical protein G6514_000462 [Epicoccum nigrum]|nr:hypothetical protein G6514_000462 [Epicoccum nigrum]